MPPETPDDEGPPKTPVEQATDGLKGVTLSAKLGDIGTYQTQFGNFSTELSTQAVDYENYALTPRTWKSSGHLPATSTKWELVAALEGLKTPINQRASFYREFNAIFKRNTDEIPAADN